MKLGSDGMFGSSDSKDAALHCYTQLYRRQQRAISSACFGPVSNAHEIPGNPERCYHKSGITHPTKYSIQPTYDAGICLQRRRRIADRFHWLDRNPLRTDRKPPRQTQHIEREKLENPALKCNEKA